MTGSLANLMTTPLWAEPYPVYFLLAMATWLGACFGSFSNVLIYRLPRNLSVVGPRSFCPGCQKQVAWYDNIPLISWVLLRARCRHCKTPPPPLHGIVMVITHAGDCNGNG